MSTRREFIRQAATAGAALAVGDRLDAIPTTASPRVLGANDKLRVAVAGVHNRGRALASTFSKMTEECEVVYICDCDSSVVPQAQQLCKKNSGIEPKFVKDYRELVKMPDIDIIVIALPDHWHAAAAIMAMQNGKHVYLEKPATHTPAENEMLLAAEKKYGTVVQCGMQRRSHPNIRKAMEIIRGGGIGEIHYCKSIYAMNRPSIGKFEPTTPPETLDWDMWQGPAPRVSEFRPNYLHYNWHWFWHWGTGEALNNGTHYVDLVRWGMKLDGYPTMVSSVGGKYRFVDDDWQTPDTQLISFQFGDKASFSWEGVSRQTIRMFEYAKGVTFFGEDKIMYLTGRDEYKILDEKGKVLDEATSTMQVLEGNLTNPSEQLDVIHIRNFFDAIRKGTPVNDPLSESCLSTLYTQYGNISQRVGRSLSIDQKTGKILGDAEAMKLWSRKYEKGWMPKI